MSVTPDTPSDLSRAHRSARGRRPPACSPPRPPACSPPAPAAAATTTTPAAAPRPPTTRSASRTASAVKVVVFNGGLGDEYAKFDETLFKAKHAKVTVNLSSTQKIKTEEQPKLADHRRAT